MLGGGSIEHRELIYYHCFTNRQLFTPRPPVWNWTRVPVTQPPVLLPSKSTLSVAVGHESRCAVKTAEVERGLPRPGALQPRSGVSSAQGADVRSATARSEPIGS